jgi:hypothetical protein
VAHGEKEGDRKKGRAERAPLRSAALQSAACATNRENKVLARNTLLFLCPETAPRLP